jgi:hypothetical protein
MSYAPAVLLSCTLLLAFVQPPTSLEGIKAEPDPGRRAEHALAFAEFNFDSARDAYVKGDIRSGDDLLDQVAKALDETVSSLGKTHKTRLYKRAEMRVAHLQRRLNGLLDEINIEQRGWAEQISRHLAEIHDRLLQGALGK